MKKSRKRPSINAGSMADIAFLLLIFFLTTTSIYNDKGLAVTLPEFYDGPIGDVAEQNVAVIRINSNHEILLEGFVIKLAQITDDIKGFILNPNKNQNLPSDPSKAVVSIQHDPLIDYEMYMNVYAEIKAAYRELYDEYANNYFGQDFALLSNKQKNVIRTEVPVKISEAEYVRG